MNRMEKLLEEYNSKIFNKYFKEINILTEGDLLNLEINNNSNIFYSYDPLDLDKREVTIYIRKEKITKNKTLLDVLLLHELLDAYISYHVYEEIDKTVLLERIKRIIKYNRLFFIIYLEDSICFFFKITLSDSFKSICL